MSLLQTPWRRSWALSAALFAATTPLQAKEPEIPPLASMCFGCHGPNGVSAMPTIPSLAGQNESYLLKRLVELKTQPTPSEIMKGVTHGISDDDLKQLAAFFARQPYVRNEQPVDQARLARGRATYNRVCGTCHIEAGRATVYGDYPLLAGQSLNYMLNELDHILSRKREVEIIKSGSLASVPRDQIEDAIHFFAGQQVSPDQAKTIINDAPRGSRRNRNRE